MDVKSLDYIFGTIFLRLLTSLGTFTKAMAKGLWRVLGSVLSMPLSAPEVCSLQILQLCSIYDAVCLRYRRWKTNRKTAYAIKLLKMRLTGLKHLSLKETGFLLEHGLIIRWRSIDFYDQCLYNEDHYWGIDWSMVKHPLNRAFEISEKGHRLLLGINVLK